MKNIDEKAENFLHQMMSEDYFRFQDVQFGLKVLSVALNENVAIIEYSFYSDPSIHDEQDFKLFDYNENCEMGFFPSCINLVTIKERYTWDSLLNLEEFTENGLIDSENLDVDVTNYRWDDENFPSDALNWALEKIGDDYSIGITLAKYFKKHGNLPTDIPKILKPRFQKLVDEFLDEI